MRLRSKRPIPTPVATAARRTSAAGGGHGAIDTSSKGAPPVRGKPGRIFSDGSGGRAAVENRGFMGRASLFDDVRGALPRLCSGYDIAAPCPAPSHTGGTSRRRNRRGGLRHGRADDRQRIRLLGGGAHRGQAVREDGGRP